MTSSSADDRELPLLEVRDVRTSFTTDRGELRAVDGVSFSLARGRTLGIVGESGSGKTVLARTVMGLLRGDGMRQSGSVRFEGREIMGASPKMLRSVWGARIAMVFQDSTASLNPVVRVGRQITESLRLHLEMDRADAKATAIALLAQVGIPAPERRYGSYPGELSGGMRQRVAVAIAIACAPRLLLADEPTTGLDVTVQAQILDLLTALGADRRMAMVLVSHDLGVVATRTDEILVMYAGRVVEQAPTRTLFASTAMPYTAALLGSTPRLADPSHTRLAAIEGRPPDPVNRPAGCPFAPRCPYVQELCRREAPPLVEAETPGHRYACWFPLGFRRGPAPVEVTR
jgi:oligopeptide/dipeptide ABC transporter ATP-binding protein